MLFRACKELHLCPVATEERRGNKVELLVPSASFNSEKLREKKRHMADKNYIAYIRLGHLIYRFLTYKHLWVL